jgi:hypothetical protein
MLCSAFQWEKAVELKYVDSGSVVGWSNKVGQGDSTRCVISPMQTHFQETGVHVTRKFVTSISDI